MCPVIMVCFFLNVIVFLADAVDTWPSHDWLCDFDRDSDC